MTVLAITRWILLRTLREPLAWGLAVVGALAWPALARLAPIGISSSEGGSLALVYEVAFIALLVGGTLGLSRAARVDPLLARATPRTRLAATAAVVATSATLWALLAGLPPFLLGVLDPVGEGSGALLGLGLAALQLAALGAALAAAPLPAPARSLGLPLLAWWVPALLGTSLLARWTASLLDVQATLIPPPTGWSPAALATRIGPMMGLYLAALLLAERGRTAPHTPS